MRKTPEPNLKGNGGRQGNESPLGLVREKSSAFRFPLSAVSACACYRIVKATCATSGKLLDSLHPSLSMRAEYTGEGPRSTPLALLFSGDSAIGQLVAFLAHLDHCSAGGASRHSYLAGDRFDRQAGIPKFDDLSAISPLGFTGAGNASSSDGWRSAVLAGNTFSPPSFFLAYQALSGRKACYP